jgi:acyl-CoA synthetase (AMP-forming)/AMP-acid ligase II
LARYKIPKKLVIVDGLPRTSSGKITKSELRTAQTATQPTTTKN